MELDSLYHELGETASAFPTIVAAGANGATPHAHAGDNAIPEGTTVVIDSAAALGGYVSDCTRTFATGELPDELARAYDVRGRSRQGWTRCVLERPAARLIRRPAT